MIDGLYLMAAGMGVVFAFLWLMVLVLNLTGAFFARRDAREEAAAKAVPSDTAPNNHPTTSGVAAKSVVLSAERSGDS
ncbi:MAG TPA: OadG family protein [Thermoleophilia bacterium]|nr:OadG family protein [Thermoleophilia bacterium]